MNTNPNLSPRAANAGAVYAHLSDTLHRVALECSAALDGSAGETALVRLKRYERALRDIGRLADDHAAAAGQVPVRLPGEWEEPVDATS